MTGADAFSPYSLLVGAVCVLALMLCLLLAGLLPIDIPFMDIQRHFRIGSILRSGFKAVTIAFVIWVAMSALGALIIDKVYDEFKSPYYRTLRIVVYSMWFLAFFFAPFYRHVILRSSVPIPFTTAVALQMIFAAGMSAALYRRYAEDTALFLIACCSNLVVIFYGYEAFFLGFYLSVDGNLPSRLTHDANVLTFILWCAIFSLGLKTCLESPADD